MRKDEILRLRSAVSRFVGSVTPVTPSCRSKRVVADSVQQNSPRKHKKCRIVAPETPFGKKRGKGLRKTPLHRHDPTTTEDALPSKPVCGTCEAQQFGTFCAQAGGFAAAAGRGSTRRPGCAVLPVQAGCCKPFDLFLCVISPCSRSARRPW